MTWLPLVVMFVCGILFSPLCRWVEGHTKPTRMRGRNWEEM